MTHTPFNSHAQSAIMSKPKTGLYSSAVAPDEQLRDTREVSSEVHIEELEQLSLGPWIPIALVLLIDERVCLTCSRTYHAPNSPMIKLTNHTGATRLTQIRTAEAPTSCDLPQYVEIVQTSIRSCPACFKTYNEAQREFWPRHRPKIKMPWEKALERAHEERRLASRGAGGGKKVERVDFIGTFTADTGDSNEQ